MTEFLYVVIAISGEYSDREEWVTAVFSDLEQAIAAAEEHKRKANEDFANHREWLLCNWDIRKIWGEKNNVYGWEVSSSIIEEKCGKEPPQAEADDFTVIKVPLNTWGRWKEVGND